MVFLAVNYGVHGPVGVQQYSIPPTPLGQGGKRSEPYRQIIHHNNAGTQCFGIFGAAIHLLHITGGHVQIMAFAFAGLRLSFVHRFHYKAGPVVPPHEGLRGDVFVILGKIQPAAQGFVHHPSVIFSRKPQLGLHGCPKERTAIFIEQITFYHDPVGWPLKGF